MADNDDGRFQHPEDVLRSGTAILVRLAGPLARQEVVKRPHGKVKQAVTTTLACIETLLARMIPTRENGREV